MVNIYDDDGHLDLDAAARELNATRAITNSTSAQATRDILKHGRAARHRGVAADPERQCRHRPHARFPYPAPDGDTATGDEPSARPTSRSTCSRRPRHARPDDPARGRRRPLGVR
jgi:hypothetical protein